MVKEEPIKIEPSSKYDEVCNENFPEQIQDIRDIENEELKAEVGQFNNGVILENAYEENFDCVDDSSINTGLETYIPETEDVIDDIFDGIKIEPNYGMEHQHDATTKAKNDSKKKCIRCESGKCFRSILNSKGAY
ncbi:hypothetical protein JTB14_031303 [Gonioctena quinquepunctata]|nr:hypothetical protein JTB14_031303 [Gonioctena quinquepunctata]